jgi:septation ring formation regulator EzrA
LEVALKSKQLELVDALKKITDTETKVYSAEEQAKELKDQLQFHSNELEKNKKIVEIVQRDYDKVKTDIIAYCQKLN